MTNFNILIQRLEDKLITKNYKPTINEGGYIAITSAIVISLLSLAIVFSVSIAGYFGRFNVLTSEFKDISLGLAEGCIEKALLKFAEDSNYVGNENITIGSRQCSILPIETSGSNKIVKAKATVEGAISNIKIVFDSSDMTIISWEELANL